jgi:hypothetical protein
MNLTARLDRLESHISTGPTCPRCGAAFAEQTMMVVARLTDIIGDPSCARCGGPRVRATPATSIHELIDQLHDIARV